MDKLAVGLQITFIGMTIVFLILVLINVALNLMHRFFEKMDQPRAARDADPVPQKASRPAEAEDQGHLIAVLTAAIAAVGETTVPFRTLSIKSVTEVNSGWKENARASVVRGFERVRPQPKRSNC